MARLASDIQDNVQRSVHTFLKDDCNVHDIWVKLIEYVWDWVSSWEVCSVRSARAPSTSYHGERPRTHEHNKTLPTVDHLSQRRPLVQRQVSSRRKSILLNPGSLEDGIKRRARLAILVGKQQRDMLARVGIQKSLDAGQVRLQGPRVLEEALSVAQLDGVVVKVRLGLQEAHALRQLRRHVRLLIVGGTRAREGAVVGAHERQVAVAPAAELHVAVAGCQWCLLREGEAEHAHEQGREEPHRRRRGDTRIPGC